MSVDPYLDALRPVFPFVVELPVRRIAEITRRLDAADDDFPNGSSYAVTSENADDGLRCLWLSRLSAARVRDDIGSVPPLWGAEGE